MEKRIQENSDNSLLYHEKLRPQFHYSPKENWVNDPNGLVYYKGIWHFYYQYNPGNGMCWGHATSTDLVFWKEEPIALFPDDVGVMWSGTGAIDVNNTSGFFNNISTKNGIVLAYSTNTQHIGIAYSLDDGYSFKKVSTSIPVLAHPDGVEAFRDPHLFWYPKESIWKMIVAGGYVRVYESKNLVDWSNCSVLNIQTECPNLLKMKVLNTSEEKWVLSLGGRQYYVGSFDGQSFYKESDLITMCEGPDSYAGITFGCAPNNRLIMLNWQNNWAYTQPADGKWNGSFTLPIELKLIKANNSYRLIQNPVDETKILRKDILLELTNINVAKNINVLDKVQSNQYEMNLEIDVLKSNNFSYEFCLGDDDKTIIKYNKENSFIYISRKNCKNGIDSLKKDGEFKFNLENLIDNHILKLRLFVDHNNIELFVNDGYYYFSMRIQPDASSKAMLFKQDGNLYINNLIIYSMKSIWFEK